MSSWNTRHDRREFLRLAALIAAPLLLPAIDPNEIFGAQQPKWSDPSRAAKLNPAFRVEEHEDGGIRVFTHRPDGMIIEYTFEGVEADLIRELMAEQSYASLPDRTVARNSGASKTEARSLIVEFVDAGLICGDHPMKIIGRVME